MPLTMKIFFKNLYKLFCLIICVAMINNLFSAAQDDEHLVMTPEITAKQSDYSNDADDEYEDEEEVEDEQEATGKPKIINKIIFSGNTLVPETAIRAKIPYHENENFDPLLSGVLIKNIHSLGYFDSIELEGEDISDTHINLHIIVHEKKKVESLIFEGNAHLKEDEINKKLKLCDVPAMDEIELEEYAAQIKNLYMEKNYHCVQIETELRPTTNNAYIAVFKITEGSPSVVKRITFQGNCSFSGKKLRSLIFTREDWILGFMDKAGSFMPDMLEGDKYQLENFYQSQGFLTARVTNIQVNKDPVDPCIINICYFIEEGDLYTIKSVSAPGNDLIAEPALLCRIPICPGQLYSRELIRKSIELLRLIWGQFGYIYADIEPQVVPNHECKTVDITFNSELGSQVFLNRINIMGNCKTRDYVIRRVLSLNEGDLLTMPQMDESKANVEMLGFFDPRDGVNWKINKVNENLADLDLVVHEVKTGKLYAQIGVGGADKDASSPGQSIKLTGGVGDRNFMGTGISYNLTLNYSKEDRGVTFSVGNPWLFNRPITGAMEGYHRKTTYEDFKNLDNIPVEGVTGVSGIVGFAPLTFPNTRLLFNAGLERIRFDNPISVTTDGIEAAQAALLQERLKRQFQPGTFNWVGGSIGQDLRNHPVHPNRGYQWTVNTKCGLPTFRSNFGFLKFEADATWFTPLINEYDLIFLLHGHAGIVKAFTGYDIPYRELFHLGGPATVRGFNWGQIGPSIFGDSLGGTKAFWVNAELIFNITRDMSIRGVLFYDGGASWDTPCPPLDLLRDIRSNNFQYRHSIGFGIRLTNPTPLKIDWGFKLDRNKRRGERASEVHFTMAHDF